MIELKYHIENIINSFDSDFNNQMKWGFLKYEICKFTISFSKNKAKSMREKKLNSEEKTKTIRREGKSLRLKMSTMFARKILMLLLMK